MPIDFTKHARERSAQRNVTPEEVRYILTHGTRRRASGVIFVFFGSRHIPAEHCANQRIAQLVGTTVVLDSSGREVITMYRNRGAPKKDRRKAKYDRRAA